MQRVYISRFDGLKQGRASSVADVVGRRVAEVLGARVVHNVVDYAYAHPDRSVKKYPYQRSFAGAWRVAYRRAEALLERVPPSYDAAMGRQVARNAIAARLFPNAFDEAIAHGVRADLGDVHFVDAAGSSALRRGAWLAAVAAYAARDRVVRASVAHAVERPVGAGPVTWLFFSGVAPSNAVANLLDQFDPARTVCLVHAAAVPARIRARLVEGGFRMAPLDWPRTVPTAAFVDLARGLVATAEASGLWEPGRVPGVELVRIARALLLFGAAPALNAIPFEPGDRVVTGNDRDASMGPFVAQAAARGAFTVTLQDGVFDDTPFVTSSPSHRVGVFGERFRRYYLRAGRAASDVVTIGARHWEGYEPVPVDPAVRRAVFGTDRKVALFCAQYYPVSDLETHDMIAFCQQALRERPDWQLVVKPHPHYPIDHVVRRLFPGPAPLVTRPLGDVLPGCDALFAFSSTSMLEAALMGRRVGAINLAGIEGLWCGDSDTGVHTVRTADDFLAVLDGPGVGDVEGVRRELAGRFDRDAACRLLTP